MASVKQETAIRQFLKMAKPLVRSGESARQLLDVFMEFYSQVRISGADLEEEGDVLLFEWGSCEPLLVKAPTDLRALGDDDVEFDEKEYQWLGLTRQVFAPSSEDAEFDDEAVSMNLFLFFGDATGDEPSSNVQVSRPDELRAKVSKLLRVPYVAGLLAQVPQRVTALVDGVG
jgi:hypothetical protein